MEALTEFVGLLDHPGFLALVFLGCGAFGLGLSEWVKKKLGLGVYRKTANTEVDPSSQVVATKSDLENLEKNLGKMEKEVR